MANPDEPSQEWFATRRYIRWWSRLPAAELVDLIGMIEELFPGDRGLPPHGPNFKMLGDKVFEIKTTGTGLAHRIYGTYGDGMLVALAAGGKGGITAQNKDIQNAKQLAGQFRDGRLRIESFPLRPRQHDRGDRG